MKYIIVEIASEYNDEVYVRQDSGGEPIYWFDSKENAEQKCKELNIARYKKGGTYESIFNYGYDVEESTGVHITTIQTKLPFLEIAEDTELWDYKFPKLTPDQWDLVYNTLVGARFYEVVAVPEG